ncbi:MAG: hypothetical protein LLG06_19850, partial [Desulfobacteraceae bacterium]|nr:hypothetical protein [Desulfobacteraceae bacterium]
MPWEKVGYDPFAESPQATSASGQWAKVNYDPFADPKDAPVTNQTPAEPKQDPGVFETIGDFASEFGRQLESSLIMAVKGKGGVSVADQDAYDSYVQSARKSSEEFLRKYGDENKKLGGISQKDLAESMSNFPFSLVSSGAGLAAGGAAFLATRSPKAAAAAAGGASGVAGYRMDSAQVMHAYLSALNDNAISQGAPMTKEEEEHYREKFDADAAKHGLWEALPEAAGNVAGFGILIKPLRRAIGRNLATKVMGKLGQFVGVEIGTEAVSQQGQQPIEVRAGIAEGPERSLVSVNDWIKSAKEVTPQVVLMAATFGLIGTASHQVTMAKKARALNAAIGEDFSTMPEPILDGLIEGARDVAAARPWDKKTPAMIAKLEAEKAQRTQGGTEIPPGQPPAAENAASATKVAMAAPAEEPATAMPKTPEPTAPTGTGRNLNTLPPEFFAALQDSLESGTDQSGQPFGYKDAAAALEAYKRESGHDPESLTAFGDIVSKWGEKEKELAKNSERSPWDIT